MLHLLFKKYQYNTSKKIFGKNKHSLFQKREFVLRKKIATKRYDNFIREILHICPNKGLCNYLEAREQMDRRVLETEDYYNGQVQCRVHKTHIKNLKA